jgi:hypothetical protein
MGTEKGNLKMDQTGKATYTPLIVTVSIVGVLAWFACMGADLSYATAATYTVSAVATTALLFAAFRLFTIGNTLIEIRDILSKQQEDSEKSESDNQKIQPRPARRIRQDELAD